jgi:protease I
MEIKPLNGMKIAILVTDGFEQVEMTEPREALEQAGAITMILSPKPDKVQGFNHVDKADSFKVDMPIKKANPDDFDGVLLPGGTNNADALRVVPEAQDFVTRIDEQNKPIAVICHGPWLLVSADLVKGKTLTSYHTVQDDIRNAGGNWVDQETVVDGNWVSSRSPKDIPAFNEAVIDLFSQYGGGQAAPYKPMWSEEERRLH